MVKKNGLRLLNKTVNINAADILSNIAAKISHAFTTNYSKNAGVVAPAPKASEDRKISRHLTFTNTTEQPTETFTKIFKSRCFEHRVAVVSPN